MNAPHLRFKFERPHPHTLRSSLPWFSGL